MVPSRCLDKDPANTISELGSEAHTEFRQFHEGHKPHAALDPSRASTGVVWTTERGEHI